MIDEKNQKSVHQQQRKEIQTQKRELGTVQFIKEEEEEVEEREEIKGFHLMEAKPLKNCESHVTSLTNILHTLFISTILNECLIG